MPHYLKIWFSAVLLQSRSDFDQLYQNTALLRDKQIFNQLYMNLKSNELQGQIICIYIYVYTCACDTRLGYPQQAPVQMRFGLTLMV